METKRSTPTEINFTKEYTGQRGKIYYYDIKFQNGDFGSFSTNKTPQVKFEIGKEVEYTIEIEEVPKKDGSGTWTKRSINIPKKDFPAKGAPAKRWVDPEKNPRIARTVALNAAIQIQGLSDNLPDEFEFKNIFVLLTNYILETAVKTSKNGSYDEGAGIASQSAIKLCILRYQEKKEAPKSLEEFFKYTNYFFKLVYTGL